MTNYKTKNHVPSSFVFEKLLEDQVDAIELKKYADRYSRYHVLVSFQSDTLAGILFRHLYYKEMNCERAIQLIETLGKEPYHLNVSKDDILRSVGNRTKAIKPVLIKHGQSKVDAYASKAIKAKIERDRYG